MDIATDIKEIADEWEKKLNKIPWMMQMKDSEPSYGEKSLTAGEYLPSLSKDSWFPGSGKWRN